METLEGNDMKVETGDSSGLNRTGIMLNPSLSAELIGGAEDTPPNPDDGDASELAASRAEYVQDALPIGSLPAVSEGGGIEPTEDQGLGEEGLSLLLDKLGERLAFERQGTRVYETFLQKLDSLRFEDDGGPSIEDVQNIYEEELQHFKLLQMVIADLGGDATVMTPSADVAGVLSQGILQIVSDPRSTVPQMLQALLTAELADNDGWNLLRNLLQQAGHSELADKCESAFQEEQQHLENVRSWLTQMAISELNGGFSNSTDESTEAEEGDGSLAMDGNGSLAMGESESESGGTDALELLKTDHETVKDLFEQAEEAEEKQQKQLFKQIKKELETHARIEESVFYPAMQEYEELKDMVLESLEEHKQMKTLLREIDKLRNGSDKFEPKLNLLKENVEHHAEEEEEGKMFPMIRELLSQSELEELGEKLAAAKGNKRQRRK